MESPLLSLLVFALIALIATAFGRKLLAILRVRPESPLERCVFGFGIGLGVLACLILGVGLAGWLYAWVLVLPIPIMALVSLGEVAAVVREVRGAFRRMSNAGLKAPDRLMALSAVTLGMLGLVTALAPPTGMDWDGLMYHLAVPKIYLARNSIVHVPYISHSNFPFLTEMLYTIGLALGSTLLAKLFHFSMYLAASASIYALGRRHLGPVAGKAGALLFMSVPVVLWEAGLAYADITTALYVTLAAYAVLNWERTGGTPWLAAAGLVGGFALGTKMLAAVPIAALCLWISAASGSARAWGRGLLLSMAVGGIALLVGSPWYIKSYLYTGNPFYPFLYDLFGGKDWSREAATAYRQAQLAFGMGRELHDFLLLPWNLLANGFVFFDFGAVYALVGVTFIGLIPISLLSKNPDKVALKLGLTSAAYVSAWFVLMQQSRYLIGVLPLFCLVAGRGVQYANERWSIGKYAVNGFVAFCILTTVIGVGIPLGMNAGRTAAGLESRDEYLSRTFGAYDAMMYANTALKCNARIVLLNENRGFYLDREYIWGDPNLHAIIPWSEFKYGEEMVGWFAKHGYTHAILNWSAARMEAVHFKLVVDAIGRGSMVEVFSSHGVSVYEFAERRGPHDQAE